MNTVQLHAEVIFVSCGLYTHIFKQFTSLPTSSQKRFALRKSLHGRFACNVAASHYVVLIYANAAELSLWNYQPLADYRLSSK